VFCPGQSEISLPQEPVQIFFKTEEEDFKFDPLEVFLFHPGDLVLARFRGYPWWPGMILNHPSDLVSKFEVLFFDTNKTTTAFVARDNVKSYEGFDDYLTQTTQKHTFPKSRVSRPIIQICRIFVHGILYCLL
jgi:hypothetical protein